MTLVGEGAAGGALTVVNAIPAGKGAAIGLDLTTEARVELTTEPGAVEVTIEDEPDGDPSLAQAAVETVSDVARTPLSGTVETTSDIPIARGLKSSSSAANAIVLAILDALDEPNPPDRVLELSVEAARRAGVTVTGALDDAAASLLGGLVVTDNDEDRVERRNPLGPSLPVLLLVPEEKQLTSQAGSLDAAAPVAERALGLVDEDWPAALTLNGLGVAAAIDRPLDPAYRALGAGAKAAGLSGTGPATGAVCTEETTASVRSAWQPYTSGIIQTRTRDQEVST